MKKRNTIIIISFLCLAILYCGVCSAYRNIKYGDFFKVMRNENPLKENGYTYYVKAPNFLSFTGNLSIEEDIRIDTKDMEWTSFSLIIWPKPFGEYEVKAGIHLGKRNPDTLERHTDIYYILLNEEWKPDESEKESWELYMKYKDEFDSGWDRVLKLKEAAENKWDL